MYHHPLILFVAPMIESPTIAIAASIVTATTSSSFFYSSRRKIFNNHHHHHHKIKKNYYHNHNKRFFPTSSSTNTVLSEQQSTLLFNDDNEEIFSSSNQIIGGTGSNFIIPNHNNNIMNNNINNDDENLLAFENDRIAKIMHQALSKDLLPRDIVTDSIHALKKLVSSSSSSSSSSSLDNNAPTIIKDPEEEEEELYRFLCHEATISARFLCRIASNPNKLKGKELYSTLQRTSAVLLLVEHNDNSKADDGRNSTSITSNSNITIKADSSSLSSVLSTVMVTVALALLSSSSFSSYCAVSNSNEENTSTTTANARAAASAMATNISKKKAVSFRKSKKKGKQSQPQQQQPPPSQQQQHWDSQSKTLVQEIIKQLLRNSLLLSSSLLSEPEGVRHKVSTTTRTKIDLNIISNLLRAFGIPDTTTCNNDDHPHPKQNNMTTSYNNLRPNVEQNSHELVSVVSQVIQQELSLLSRNNNDDYSDKDKRGTVSAVLLLASQVVAPCYYSYYNDDDDDDNNDKNNNDKTMLISPVELVEAAIPFDLWHAAETILEKMSVSTTLASKEKNIQSSATNNINDNYDNNHNNHNNGISFIMFQQAMHLLIDESMNHQRYRQADGYATKFFHHGGLESRFIEARYAHACKTIAKIIQKGQLPIIERQVERIDRSIQKVHRAAITTSHNDHCSSNNNTNNNNNSNVNSNNIDYSYLSHDIRLFAIQRLQELGRMDSIQRLVDLWGFNNEDHSYYSPEDIAAAIQARREKYLQWKDVFSSDNDDNDDNIPDLLSTPEDLYRGFRDLLDNEENGLFGFDVEWGGGDDDDNNVGAAATVLQIASTKNVILIDIPALSMTFDGADALEKTVGRLFFNNNDNSLNSSDHRKKLNPVTMVGFSCKQDISKLRSCPCIREKNHWFRNNHNDNNNRNNDFDDDNNANNYDDNYDYSNIIGSKKRVRNNDTTNHAKNDNNNNNNKNNDSNSNNVVDLAKIIWNTKKEYKGLGLSRICELYLGKPLDKSEQCSSWESRPLSLEQRIYASLDAVVCAIIYIQLFPSSKMTTMSSTTTSNTTTTASHT